jgi:hypothetical protein
MSSLFPFSFFRSVRYGVSPLGQLTARAVFRCGCAYDETAHPGTLVAGSTDWDFCPQHTRVATVVDGDLRPFAELAVNLAGAMVLFLVQTWEAERA